jgi:hypothetical protein
MPLAHLPDRSVVEISGEDRVGFLNGLVSNDVGRAAPGSAVWAALLTPQGKWLADFFILATPERLLLDVEAADAPGLIQRLGRFRLRAKVALREAAFAVHAAWGEPPAEGLAARDPRLADAGWRVLLPAPAGTADAAAYDRHRLSLGLPDGSRDLEAEKSVLLEAGFDELGGISWTKGCWMGQELTARTRYRGLVKKRLVPVDIDGPLPPRGTPVTAQGSAVGEMRSGREGLGLALLRLEALAAGGLTAGAASLTPRIPPWMVLPGRHAA